jgi:hypothetical protein
MQDFIGVGQNLPARFGKFQATSSRTKQRRPEVLFKMADLSANGLRREIQRLSSTADATHLGNRPEIPKMLEVHVTVR